MKKIITASLLLFAFHSYSQSIERQVVTTSGSYMEQANGSLSSTTGELISKTFEQSNAHLTQGFQQTTFTLTSVNENIPSILAVDIFPNPTVDVINLKSDESNLIYRVIDLKGQIIEEGNLINGQTKINLLPFAKNIYIVEVYSSAKNIKNTFKVTKN